MALQLARSFNGNGYVSASVLVNGTTPVADPAKLGGMDVNVLGCLFRTGCHKVQIDHNVMQSDLSVPNRFSLFFGIEEVLRSQLEAGKGESLLLGSCTG